MLHEEYVKESKIKDKSKEEMNVMLLKSILETKKELEGARKNYEYAEGDLIDYYLYQIKANQSKLNYLIKLSKKNGIIIDMIKQIEIQKIEEPKVI